MKKPEYNKNPKIVVTETTKKQLDNLKLVSSETYDSVIVRLVEQATHITKGIKINKSVKREVKNE